MEAPVCALVDAMFRLPAKLDALLVRHGHMLPRGAAAEIPLIKQDLEKMVAILQEQDGSGAQDRAMMVKCLTKEVRELSYDMEDSVDQYEHAAGTRRCILSPGRRKYKITRRRGKTCWRLPEKLKWRLWMANKLREFSLRSQGALQRYSSLDHLGVTGISSSTAASNSSRCDASFGSWHPTLYWEPVGISAPLKKLESWLDKDGEQKLKVVSLVGPGGVGKTTLASELYRRIRGQFECRAFVRTSRKPDVRRLLISMLSQVRPHQTPHTWKVHSLIADIRTHLQNKRYLIVIDDIWDTQTCIWDIINRALPDGNLCSGVLITTEVEDVALKCCGYDSKYVFTMKPLGHDDSRKLFFNIAFGPTYECPSELSEFANSIIRKCAGLPLAMFIVAKLLVSQTGKAEQWDYVNNSLGYGLRTNQNPEGMKQVLNLSYNSLPEHLKPCVMYLSMYEEDYIIQKDDFVNQWVSEGFICATKEKDKEEISRSYFDELISTRIIQPVHVNDNDDVLSFSVHYMVLDFVTQKSTEENFVTTIDHCQTTARVADKVRRLSLHFGNAEATSPTNMGLSQVRTVAFFGIFKCLPCIMKFGLLQVLILHLWGDDESINFDLTRICELFRLRYFHVTSNTTLEVQTNQMRGLQYLETLKIDARVSTVPSDIVHLPGLLHLSLPVKTNIPNSIGHMTSLRSLGYFDISVNSTENMQSLGELTNLQELRLTCSTEPSCYTKSKMDNMGSVLAKLSNLRSLTLEPSSILGVKSSSMSISCDWLSIISSPPALIQRFEWLPHICTFPGLPKWIGHLDKLCILKIGVSKLASDDVDVLRGLPALTVLSLYVRTKPGKRIVFSKTGFFVLKYLKFRCSVPWLEFEVGTMPNLRRLKLGFDAHGADQHGTILLGIEHLLGLKEISAKIGGGGADDPDRMNAESALNYATKMHPARPTFNIQQHVGRMFTGNDDCNSSLQEEEHMTLQKQCEIMEEDLVEQHQVIQKDSREDAHSRMPKLSKKRRTQVRVRSVSDVRPLDDGFSWRKYGQKDILGSKYPRAYFRCTHRVDKGCTATKQVQRTDIDPLLFDVVYNGEHTCAQSAHLLLHHGQVAISSSKVNSEVISGSESTAGVRFMFPGMSDNQISHEAICGSGSALVLEHTPPRDKIVKKRKIRSNTQMKREMQVRVGSLQDTGPLDDGFSWRKYGQKQDMRVSKYPRSYYRCTYQNVKGCSATKQVQRKDIDPLLFDVVYNGEHTCGQSAANPLLHHGQVAGSISLGFKESPGMSGSQITWGDISESTAGVQSMSPAIEAMLNSQVNSKAISGSGSTSNSQITSEAVSGTGSTAGSWSTELDEVDSLKYDMLDPDFEPFDLDFASDQLRCFAPDFDVSSFFP